MFSLPVIVDETKDGVTVSNVGTFSPHKTFDCGQCFRFSETDGTVSGIVGKKRVSFRRDGDLLYAGNVTADEFSAYFMHYLSLDRDYDSVDSAVATALPRESDAAVMREAVRVSSGIRILRQEKWETLCSFIVSQNNNIPRIKKIVSALCASLGERIGDGDYAFPDAKTVLDAGEEKIFSLGTGFRAPYIIDAARHVAEDGTFLDRVAAADSYEDADALLRTVKGVGPKVSACTLLFGFSRTDAFPIDVWIKRVMEKYFPDGLDYNLFGDAAGIAQQYLFYYERYVNEGK